MKESDIQKSVFDYLTEISARNPGLFFFSIPNEAFLMAAKIAGLDGTTAAKLSTHLKKMGMVPGVPDMCVLLNKRAVFFEFKKPGAVPSLIQSIVHRKIRQSGHVVRVIESVEDAKIFLSARGVE
jgi:hypothetical protein